ncbi:Gfo/Idh/MocA family protein [Burkholderia anthina]|uniref:Gfo/Idh/MocA family protein n=1 Tax=Burkholderia anthina TaxID=179879 RepID=UPI001FC81D16|nr:Gfo/Idh/MocA family oxidoreductase [Burkholderia anthina]
MNGRQTCRGVSDHRRSIGYEALIARKDIDALYIPLPTAVRTEWAVKAAQAGKHIVIEKPCGIDAADLQRIVDAVDASGVQVMDGVMFQHSSRTMHGFSATTWWSRPVVSAMSAGTTFAAFCSHCAMPCRSKCVAAS